MKPQAPNYVVAGMALQHLTAFCPHRGHHQPHYRRASPASMLGREGAVSLRREEQGVNPAGFNLIRPGSDRDSSSPLASRALVLLPRLLFLVSVRRESAHTGL